MSANLNHFAKQFEDATDSIVRDGVTAQHVVDMLIAARKLIEATKSKAKFKFINLFGNWILHPELHQHLTILEEINDFLAQLLRGDGGGPFGPEISAKFKLDELRSELLALSNQHGVPDTALKDDAIWKSAREKILEKICESPLTADQREVARLAKLPTKSAFVVTAVKISQDAEMLRPYPGEKFAFVIEMREIANLAADPRRLISTISL